MSNSSMRPGVPPGRGARRGVLSRPLFVLLSLIALCAGYTISASRPLQAAGPQRGGATETPERISPSAMSQIEALLAEKRARTPEQKKISSRLLYAARIKNRKPVAGVTTLRTKVDLDAAGQARVDIRTTDTAATAALVAKLGGKVEAAYPKWNSVLAWMPLESLEGLAAEKAVRSISVPSGAILNRAEAPVETPASLPAGPPTAAEEKATRIEKTRARVRNSLAQFQDGQAPILNVGLRNSQGDATHGANQARGLFGVNGTGLRIGVLSDSFNNLGAAGTDVTNGDLPGPGNPNGFTTPVQFAGSGDFAGGGSDEGRAMLQIVHDLAPGAQLYFATAFNSMEDFASNITALRAAGCDIIIDDVIYLIESGLHKGQSGSVVSPNNMAIVTQAVNDVTASGALYFSSAGNQGSLTQGTSAVWEGDFVSGGNFTIPGDSAPSDVLDWDQTAAVSQSARVLAGSGSPIAFQWADPLGGSTNDYDIFVLNSTLTTVFDASAEVQDGTQDPLEFIGGGAFTNERIVIVRFAGNPVFLSMTTFGDRIQFGTSGQTRGHSTAENGFGVAATPAAATFGAPTPNGPFPGVFVGTNQVENFSSDGPRRVFFNADGTAITPGNFLAAGGQLLQKPDVTAADGVDTTLPPASGLNPFYGTSAAAPHAGAIAALVKSAAPTATPAQIRGFLQSTTLDIMAGGTDRDSGFGILQARQAVAATGAQPIANLMAGAPMASEVAGPTNSDGDGNFEPCEEIQVNLPLSNVGGLAATGVNATLSTLTPAVIITQGASSYGTIAAGGSQTNATPFRFKLAPCFSNGTSIAFSLTVTYGGGPSPQIFTFNIATGCGIGASSAVSFTNPANISIPSSGNATPYPSAITVTGVTAPVTKVTATLNGFSHTFPDDVDVILVGPGGQSCVLLSDVGTSLDAVNLTLTLDDAAAASLPDAAQLVSGTFKPTNIGATDNFPAPGPGSVTQGTPLLSVFNNVNPNGTWNLFVVDDLGGDLGAFAGGWTLNITTAAADCSTTATCPVVQNLNNQLSLSVSTQAPVAASTACVGLGYATEISLSGTLTNTSSSPVSCGYFEVVELRPANGTVPTVPFRLVTDPATCGGGNVGTRQSFPNLAPGQSVPISFTLVVPGAPQRTRFLLKAEGYTTMPLVSRNLSAPPAGPEKGFDIAFDGKGKAVITDLTRTAPTNTAVIPRKSTGSK